MKKSYIIYSLLFLSLVMGFVSLPQATKASATLSNSSLSSPYFADPDSTKLRYPMNSNRGFYQGVQQPQSGLYLRNPSNITTNVVYDPLTNSYIQSESVGQSDIQSRQYLSFEDYQKMDSRNALRAYWKQKSMGSFAGGNGGIIPDIYIQGKLFDKIFGGNKIDVKAQGSVELIFGILANKTDDPNRNVNQRSTTNFDFQEKIQMNVVAKVGTKMEFKVNYDTEATFSFENKLSLKYTGEEDEIIQLIEAGDVNLPLNSQLIQGSQSLFGIKTKLQFGNTTVTAVYSEQKSENSSVTVEGGAQKNTFILNADDYEENKHFFLAQYFVDKYDISLKELPMVLSSINITKLELWITNIGAATEENRNLIALTDLGEVDPYNTRVSTNPMWQGQYPDNESNDLINGLLDPAELRSINTVSNYLKGNAAFNMEAGRDFEKIESARKLGQSEYAYNSSLGFISLYTLLNSNQSLAVSFQYTIIGNDKTYQVGEFSDGGIPAPSNLIVKLLKSTTVDTRIPMWDLMMKNVYSLNAYQVNPQDFILNILYSGSENGVPTGYFDFGPDSVKGVPLIQVMGFDRLTANGDVEPDGIFDFIDGAATSGGTIQSSNGRIYFTSREPFGSALRESLGPEYAAEADKVCYDSLYTLTKTGAQQYPDKNKYLIEGYYKSSSGSDISLNALNVPQGSVSVTAGGRVLQENVDYTVDYTLGRVKIINEALLSSGTPLTVSLENNSAFGIQKKRYMGMHIDHLVNENLTIGGTIINLNERPLTTKTNIGDDPINNVMWGANFEYQNQSRWLTKMVDAIPGIQTKEESQVTFSGEFAQFIPGHNKVIGNDGTSYIDDFEGATTTIDLKTAAIAEWFHASVPQGQPQLFPGGKEVGTGSLVSGFNRADINWYVIDPLFYDRNGTLVPENVTQDELSKNSVRQVLETEVWPNKEIPNGVPTNIPVLNVAYYPEEKGPYNYLVEEVPGIADGIDENGKLLNPQSRWGGMMRQIETSDFEENNVEYIEFWMMDPFSESENPEAELGGDIYFHLGDISEDLLPDSRKSFENGLPTSTVIENVYETNWARVPTTQDLTGSFDNDPESRTFQDIGYDGVNSATEQTFFGNYLTRIENTFGSGSAAYVNTIDDPSADDYQYFRGDQYDTDPAYSNILTKYKKYNRPEGNSPANTDANPDYITSSTTRPNVEDIDGDNTLWEDERYFQYKVSIRPGDMQVVGENCISDIYHAQSIRLANGEIGNAKWYQFKIPISQPESKVGNISDFRSIRFMRMIVNGFEKPVVLRFATLELVRAEWRRYQYDLLSPGEYVPDDRDNNFAISTVNIEENGYRSPVPYVLPPGIYREQNYGTLNYVQLNEQSMMLTVEGLQDGDARAVYKTAAFDFRQYKYLKMFVHAEDVAGYEPNEYAELEVFMRLGSDFTENYYEYSIPLTMTPWYTPASDDDIIWPESNDFSIDLEKLVAFKVLRNVAMRDPSQSVNLNTLWNTYDGVNRVTIRGTPTISDVRTVMIGIRNPKKQTATDPDDGEEKSTIVWVDELRLTDFINKSGWAATARMRADLADFGNFEVAGFVNTPGFGSIEQKTNERSLETNKNIDVATNLAMGKFFPEEWGVNIPVHFDYSRQHSMPEYNPLDPDVEMDTELDTWKSTEARDSIRTISEDLIKRININVLNVRKARTNLEKTPMPWDISNFDVSYAYSATKIHNIDVSYDDTKTHDGGLGYNYTVRPKEVKPLSKVKAFNNPWLKLFKEFNFYYLPKSFTFRTDMNREYQEKELRVKSIGDIIIQPTYYKDWTWTRNYNLQWDLAKSLKLTYTANTAAYINELPGSLDDDGKYTQDEKQKEISTSFSEMGIVDNYAQNVNLNYKLPLDKLPLTDWITANAKYSGGYIWTANTRALQDDFGNVVQNNNTKSINGTIKFTSLYNKVPYFKKLNSKRKKRSRSFSPPGRGVPSKPAAADSTKKEGPSVARKVMDNFFKFVMMVKDANFNYSVNQGMLMPGFTPTPQWFGTDGKSGSAPGWDFVFGWYDAQFPQRAIENNWISSNVNQNQAFSTKYGTNLSAKVTLEPISDFRIDFTATRTYTESYQAYYVAVMDTISGEINWQLDDYGNYQAYTPQESGNFSITTIAIQTSFSATDPKTLNSETFNRMKDNREVFSARLGEQNPNSIGSYSQGDTLTLDNYADGYGPTSSEVLHYSFLSAYRDVDPEKMKMTPFPAIPLPNWRITYKGLSKLSFMKKYFKNVTLQHAYVSTYNVGNYSSNVLYEEQDGGDFARDDIGNIIQPNQISQVVISEQFAPFIGINLSMKNNFTFDFQYKKTRNLALSFTNNQLTEQTGNDLIFGVGYRFNNIPIIFANLGKAGSRIKSDLNIKADVSISDKRVVMRMLDTGLDQISQGQKMVTIGFSADYKVSKSMNIRLFYDQTINNPYLADQFATSTINSGISIRFSLTQ